MNVAALRTAAAPARPGRFKLQLTAPLSRGLQLKPTQLHWVCVCVKERVCLWWLSVGRRRGMLGGHDDIICLEMKHPPANPR